MTLPIDSVLVRHAESEENAAKRRSKEGDDSSFTDAFRKRHTVNFRLTNLGQAQAKATGEWLRKEFFERSFGFDYYMSSDFVRAQETSGLLDLPDANWRLDSDLCERDWGELRVCPEDERRAKFGEALQRYDEEPFLWKPPGNGESQAEVCGRLRGGPIAELRRRAQNKRVLITSHGGVMWAMRILYERMPQGRYKELYLSNNPAHRITNCQVIHYTRRNPANGKLDDKTVRWVRMVRPAETPIWDTGWQEVVRPSFTNRQMLDYVSKIPRIIT